MIRVFKYKLKMNRAFLAACEQTLEGCRNLHNAALTQRIAAYKLGTPLRFVDQSRGLTEARELPEVASILRAFQEQALRRLDESYKAFFRRVKAKQGRAGFPRFKGQSRFDSFSTTDSSTFRFEGDKIIVHKIGSCRVRLSRPLQGRPRALTVKRTWNGWYVAIACDSIEPSPLPPTGCSVGVDVGLESFATLSNGSVVINPRYFRKSESALGLAQQRLALKTKGSESRKRAKRLVAKAHATIQRQRDWFHWQQARELVKSYDLIAVEQLNVKGMAQSNLAKSIHDVGWTSFIEKLFVKAEEAGRVVVKVSARFTSQDCSGCGHRQKLGLSERMYNCPNCGLSLNRDHNAAINILGRAVPSLKTEPAIAGC